MQTRKSFLRRHRVAVTVLATMEIVAVAYLAAFALRFDGSIPEAFTAVAYLTLPIALAAKAVSFWWTGVFASSWRHFSIRDLDDVLRGNIVGSILFLTSLVFLHGLDMFPR